MSHRKRLLRTGALLATLPGTAWAIPEGTPQLGPTQGLAGFSVLRLDVTRAGETIRLCSSDDGFKEPDADGFRLESNPPGVANPIVEPRRIGSEILIAPPTLTFCMADDDCDGPARCYTDDLFPVPVAGVEGVCAIPFSVTQNGPGYCNFGTGPGNWQTHIADEVGAWFVNFISEPETLSPSDESTRYFAVDVLQVNGQPAAGGRLHTPAWRINAHQFSYGTSADFFVVAPVRSAQVSGARVFVIDLQNVQGFQYQILANTLGLENHPSQSWCQFGNPDAVTRNCPFFNGGPVNAAFIDYDLYLNYPDPAPAPAPAPELGNVTFNDSAGTNTITPNGDGIQDSGTFQFSSNVNAVYRITIDTDRDNTFDPTRDRVLSGEALSGANQAVWNGNDAAGRPVADGRYRFQVEITTAEIHFPMVDIERNLEGFTISEQAGVGAQRVPRRMYWDDTRIRGDADLNNPGDAITTLPDGSTVPADGIGAEQQRRFWRQPQRGNPNNLDANGNPRPEDVPQIYDTWVQGDRVSVTEALCNECEEPFVTIIVGGEDEAVDRDMDGILDSAEDRDRDGVVDPDESNPLDPDTDDDGIPDNVEDADRDGVRDPGETNPNDTDSDDDGLADGAEDANRNGNVDVGETNPRVPDTDDDGVPDGAEDVGNTDPLDPDSDDDGLTDGEEDTNGNGRIDDGESNPRDRDSDDDGIDDGDEVNGANPTDPTNPDTDEDGVLDGIEDADRDGTRDPGETDPNAPDSDGDGLDDGTEDANGNGMRDGLDTDPLDPDTDGDGLGDGTEDANENGARDPGESDPRNVDTDLDGLTDDQEDANGNGQRDPGETATDNLDTDGGGEPDGSEVRNGRDPVDNPNDDVRDDTDSDMDGSPDNEEDANGNGIRDPGETDPNNPDTDGDGLSDGTERHGTNPTSPVNADSDGDGILDGVEDANQNGALDDGETNPLDVDSDDDGIEDGAEDTDRDGEVDDLETNPRDADTDDDGLADGVEDANQNGAREDGETNPRVADSDQDGLDDGAEDSNRNGIVDAGETDPRNADTDGGGELDGSEVENGRNPVDNPADDVLSDTDMDGIPDVVEDADQDGVFDNGETNPRDPDTDADGLPDGLEDANRNGSVDEGETDPRTGDTDGDGLNDGAEDANRNGSVDEGETDPRLPDTDGDGLGDGLEEDTGTDGSKPDTDGDGLPDGEEDRNLNGRVDEGETDPRLPDTDGDGLTDDVDPDPTRAALAPDAGFRLADYTGSNPTDGCACDLGGRSPSPVALVLPLLLLGLRRRRPRG